MNLNATSNIAARKARWRDFYDMDKPPSHLFLIRYSENGGDPPLPNPHAKQERIDWAWDLYENDMARTEWLDDDSIPHLNPYTGTEIFAEAFGCPVHRPDFTNPFARPLVQNASEASRLRVPDLSAPCLSILFDIADELRARGGPEAIMRLVDIQSPMDIAALIWEKTDFFVAVIENPAAVRELADKVRLLLTAFLDEWFSRYGVEFIAHYPDYYMPGGVTLSEDEIGAVSPDVFEALFLPQLTMLSRRYGGIGIHCCADARHQWEHLKRIPNLQLLNLVQPVTELQEAYQYFASQVPQMHNWCGDGDPLSWTKHWPEDCRAVLQVSAESRSQALEQAHKLRALFEQRNSKHAR